MENNQIPVWSVDRRDVAELLSKELDIGFPEHRVTWEMVEAVAKAYEASFREFIEDHGISFRGTRLPSDVWDVVENLAKPFHRDRNND